MRTILFLLLLFGSVSVVEANSKLPLPAIGGKTGKLFSSILDEPQKKVIDADFCCRCAIAHAWCADGTEIRGSACDCAPDCTAAYIIAYNIANQNAVNNAATACLSVGG